MSEERERLFRDDIGAALERVSRLEEENRRLRAEVERLERGTEPRPTRRRPPTTVLVAALSTVLMSAMVVASATRGHHCHARRAHAPPSPFLYEAPREMAPQ